MSNQENSRGKEALKRARNLPDESLKITEDDFLEKGRVAGGQEERTDEEQELLDSIRKENEKSYIDSAKEALREAGRKLGELGSIGSKAFGKIKEKMEEKKAERDASGEAEGGSPAAGEKKKKKPRSKDFTETADDTHDKLFGLVKKYFILILLAAVFATLITALIMTVNKSSDANSRLERVKVESEPDVMLETEEELLWKKFVKEDVEKQGEGLRNLNEKMDGVVNAIKEEGVKNKSFLTEQLTAIREENRRESDGLETRLSGRLDSMEKMVDEKIGTAVKNLPQPTVQAPAPHPTFPKDAVLLPMPKGSKQSVPQSGSASTGPIVSTEQAVEVAKEEAKAKKQERIYQSLSIENISMSGESYDVVEVEEENTTLPPFVIRKGFTNGVNITGVSAPTFDAGAENPKPVLISFGPDSIISNDYTQDVEGCLATGTASGNIITRRAEILISTIECTFTKDNKQYAIREKVKAWIIDGNDGRYGMKGRLVDSSGKLIANSVIIGLLKGMGDFTSATAQAYLAQGMNSAQVVGSTGAQPMFDMKTVAQSSALSGMGEGLASGFDTVNEYYERIINALMPYVDVKAGRKVTVYFEGGETITPKEYRPVIVNQGEDYADLGIEIEVNYENW